MTKMAEQTSQDTAGFAVIFDDQYLQSHTAGKLAVATSALALITTIGTTWAFGRVQLAKLSQRSPVNPLPWKRAAPPIAIVSSVKHP